MLYADTLRNYIRNIGEKRILFSEIAMRIIPLVEKIVYESNEPEWRKKDLACLLSRFYLLAETAETKIRNLKEKKLISETEYQNDLTWAFLMDKLGFTKEEKIRVVSFSVSRADWENYSSRWYAETILFFLPNSVLERFRQNIDKQKEFLSVVREAVKSYPDAFVNCCIIQNISKRFDRELLKKELAKIRDEVPNSLAAQFIRFLRLKEKFFSPEGDKKQLIKAMAGVCDALSDENIIRSFLQESVAKKIDEETLLLLFSEFINRVGTDTRINLINNIAPESIRSRLKSELGLKEKETGEEIKNNLASSQKTKEVRVLVNYNLENLKEALDSIGWGTEIFSKETDLNSPKYKLIILRLEGIGSWDENDRFVHQPSLLPRIINSLDDGVFILIISGKSNLIPAINPLLSQFNCYVDEKKMVHSEPVFLPGVFKDTMDAQINYHSRIGAGPGVNWQWEKFHIQGPPVYAEKGKVLINADGYPLAVSIPLPNGTFIISGDIDRLYSYPLSFSTCDLYDGLIFRNIWQILLDKMFDGDSTLTPVYTIKQLYDFYWEFRLGEKILTEQNLVDPLSGWVKRKERSFPEKEKHLASAKILKDVLKGNLDSVIRRYCFFYLGLILRFQGQNEEALSYLEKARENTLNYEDTLTIAFFLVDTLLRKENFSKDDYKTCSKYCQKGLALAAKDAYRQRRFYDLQGRLEEKVKNYAGALASYAKMAVTVVNTPTTPQFSDYALFRRACLLYKSGNLTEAEKSFFELIRIISNDFSLKPDTWSQVDFYHQGENEFGLIPLPFEIKVASYLYLREIAKREKKGFLCQKELEEAIEAAEKWNISDENLLAILPQLKVILREN